MLSEFKIRYFPLPAKSVCISYFMIFWNAWCITIWDTCWFLNGIRFCKYFVNPISVGVQFIYNLRKCCVQKYGQTYFVL